MSSQTGTAETCSSPTARDTTKIFFFTLFLYPLLVAALKTSMYNINIFSVIYKTQMGFEEQRKVNGVRTRCNFCKKKSGNNMAI